MKSLAIAGNAWGGMTALVLALGACGGPAWAAPAPLTSALQVRSLSAEEAAKGHEVSLRAIVTYNDSPGAVFVQDATAGTFFRPRKVVTLQPGDEIELHGYTQPALYVPGIERATFQVVGTRELPAPTAVTYADLASGRFHYQWVSVEGIVRSAASVDDGHAVLRLHDGTQIVEVIVNAPFESARIAVNSPVRARGLASGRINSRRQLVRPYLQAGGWQDIEELEPAQAGQAVPLVTTAELLTFNAAGHPGGRARLRGTVLAAFGDGRIFLRDDKGATAAQLNPFVKVEVGDGLEVIGFLEMHRFSASLVDAEVRERAPGPPPRAVTATVASLFERGLDCELVAVTGVVTDAIRDNDGMVFFLSEEGKSARVRMSGVTAGPEPGTRVRVTGICQVESTDVQPYRSVPAAVSLRVRAPDDVVVLHSPPWWTMRRMMFALASVVVLALAAAGWILVLRRQVERQTQALRRKIERESAFEERQRLAREFHDTLEQDLTGVSLQLSTASARDFDAKGRGLVEASRNLISHIQREVRSLVSDLRETEDGATGPVDVAALLHRIAHERAAERCPRIMVTVPAEPWHVPAPVGYHLRMIVQECITNVLKHAGAEEIHLKLEAGTTGAVVRIADDGAGFDPSAETFGKRGHFGCMGIRERCVKIAASVCWQSSPGAGTVVEIALTSSLPKPAAAVAQR